MTGYEKSVKYLQQDGGSEGIQPSLDGFRRRHWIEEAQAGRRRYFPNAEMKL